MTRLLPLLLILALFGAGPTPIVRSTDDGRRVAELLGVLTFTQLSVDFVGTPAREAINEVRHQLDLPIVARYDDDRLAYGIDPERPITLALEDEPALEVLEEILRQCDEPGAECTWQIRRGFIEVGTKSRLSVPAACETRTYYIADLIIDVPNFGEGTRRRREVLALNLVQRIVETIEPDAWDYGQIDYDDDVGGKQLAPQSLSGAAPAIVPAAPPGRAQTAPAGPRYVSPRKIATIRFWRDILIVHAPDYIHRELGGYPEPIRPDQSSASSPSTK